MYKPERLSKGVEQLLLDWEGRKPKPYDVVIVGSGYGGAVAAARLAALQDKASGEDLDVCVLERGREHLPGTFPSSFSELPGHVRLSRFDDPVAKGARDGLFDLRVGEDVSVLVASGLGGGSLINAGLTAVPEPDVFADPRWPGVIQEEFKDAKLRTQRYQDARQALGASVDDKVKKLAKHQQFVEFGKQLDGKGKSPDLAQITVDHDTCKQCGDCATGCNFGAKKTLSHTYLERAYRHHAMIYTGATVSHIEKRRNGQWAVFVAPTVASRPLQKEPLRKIRAKMVILAAGSLGSTEILMRSGKRCRELRLSKCLGARFSTNGDMISVLYGQKARVNAAPEEHKDLASRGVGPTITGITTIGDKRSNRIVVEELAIPGALRRVFEEVVTTSAMLDSFAKPDNDDHAPLDPNDRTVTDPAAINPDLVDSCQVFAAMGDDGADGRVELVPGWDDEKHLGHVHDGAVKVHWRDAGTHDIYKEQDKVLSAVSALGGRYLRNPLWRPLPAGVTGALSGAKPTGMLFSVHPLGGCPMGKSAAKGVVDDRGRVFDPAGDFHKDLLVLDGSIVPTALGTNPLLTITVLAERAIDKLCSEGRWSQSTRRMQSLPALPPKLEPKPPKKELEPKTPDEAFTGIRFKERMTGKLSFDGTRVSAVEAELTLEFEPPVDDLRAFLRQPFRPRTVKGTLQLHAPAVGGKPATVHEAGVTGTIALLVRGRTTGVERKYRAIMAYWRVRGSDIWDLVRKQKGGFGFGRIARAVWAGVKAAVRDGKQRGLLTFIESFDRGKDYVTFASHVGEVRHLLYSFTLDRDLRDFAGGCLPATTVIQGQKTLAYAAGGNPWQQLTDLELTRDDERIRMGTLTVDPAYFFQGFRSQLHIMRQRDLPAALMDLASLALLLARIILKIHFWSFRLPDYQPYDPERDRHRLPGPIEGLHMQQYPVGYPQTPQDDSGVFLLLTRYRLNKGKPGKPVLMIHGLGSGGIQFATRWAEPSMAKHLAKRGFDVWVAELRTSIALPSSLDQWTLDEVARGDIPRLVDLVLKETRERQLDVVAHCIGSAMFCTAVLDGKLQHESGASKIRRAVLLQVGPLITLSKGTRLRGLVGAPLRRFLPDGHVDFSVDDRATWMEAMIDRVLATYPYPKEEPEHHKLRWWDKRHNFHIANCNRWAAIDGRMFQHENISPEMLDHLGEVLGHSSLTTWTQTLQYAFLERLTDSEARNSYVTADNVRQYFTFPVRFLHGAHNDVFLPLTSLRSQELLLRVHGKDFPAEVVMLPKYGHFDPLIGKDAATDVFDKIDGFLESTLPSAPQTAPKAEQYYFRRPLIGPVVGWLRPDPATGVWSARIWARIDDLRSPASSVLVQVFKDGTWRQPRRVECPRRQKPGKRIKSLVVGPIDTILCIDVELGKETGDYKIVVLSVHEAPDALLLDQHQQAERDAGKKLSSLPHLSLKLNETLDQALKDKTRTAQFLKDASAAQPGDSASDDKVDCAIVNVPEPSQGEALTFAIASCRYPGSMTDRDQADAAFGRISALIDNRAKGILKPAALFLVGDQIYADATAGAFDPKDRRERFYEAYREAWTALHAGMVLSRLPVYMMMDDHESGNDWHPDDVLSPDAKAMHEHGLEAFRQYQWLHSPGNTAQPRAQAPERDAYWYRFELRNRFDQQGYPVFVCDTRSGRSKGRAHMLDDKQFQALKQWLKESKKYGSRPKLVVSSSVVVPFTDDRHRAERSDGWDGYDWQLRKLFGYIARHGIQNVVFLCGDSHLSNCSEIEISDGQQVRAKAYCIVASPMYAPYPFANAKREEFLADNCNDPLPLPNGHAMRYKVLDSSWVAGDSFALVTLAPERVDVRIGERFETSFALASRAPVGSQ